MKKSKFNDWFIMQFGKRLPNNNMRFDRVSDEKLDAEIRYCQSSLDYMLNERTRRKRWDDRYNAAMSYCISHNQKKYHCVWNQNEDGQWNTSCNQIHEFITGTSKDNKYNYCPYCGRILKVKQ